MKNKVITLKGRYAKQIATALTNTLYNWTIGEASLTEHGKNVFVIDQNDKEAYDVSGKSIEDIIQELRLFNVFVVSLPRCGSSMTTHIVELLGVNLAHTSEDDDKKDQMDKQYKKKFGEYHPNEAGFFEVTQNLFGNYLDILSVPYSGCKMITPVTRPRLDVITHGPSKVLQMWRDPEEIRQSQEAFYSRDSDIAFIRTALVQDKLKFENLLGKENYMQVEYRGVVEEPKKWVNKIAKFINAPNDPKAAIASINPKATRFKKEELVEGI